MNTGRVIGLILVGVGLVICLLGVVIVVGTSASGHTQTLGGRVIGVAIAAVLAIPCIGAGAFLFIRGQQEEAQLAVVRQEKRLLGMIDAQGQVSVAEAALDLGVTRDQVKEYIYDLVNKGLFTGYINWDDGELISVDMARMEDNKCPHCGGELELAGKGVIECPYCGSEIFLS
jgi:DNA-directed RNA polymerase subunit RPC12/RpoP